MTRSERPHNPKRELELDIRTVCPSAIRGRQGRDIRGRICPPSPRACHSRRHHVGPELTLRACCSYSITQSWCQQDLQPWIVERGHAGKMAKPSPQPGLGGVWTQCGGCDVSGHTRCGSIEEEELGHAGTSFFKLSGP